MVKKLAIFLLAIFISSCASTYQSRMSAAHGAYHRGDYTRALKLMDGVEPAPRDRLLFLFDKGMVLHALGKYEESNKVLNEAEELSGRYAVKSATRETAAALWSEEAAEYAGDKHERVTIPVVRMLNYVMLDDWDGALVEARHVRLLAEKTYGNSKDFDNAFSLYLSAIIWEALGHINDAVIDYRQIISSKKEVPYVAADVKATSNRLGLGAAPPGSEVNSVVSKGYRKKGGQLVVILETGVSPSYAANNIATGYFSVSVPMLMGGEESVDFADVKIDGRPAGRTYPFYNISEDIFDALKDRQKRSFVRKMVKLSVQGGLYGAGFELAKSKDSGEKAAGAALILLGFTMSAAEQADTRSWRTLPAEFQIGRFYLDPGVHEIEIAPSGGSAVSLKKMIEVGKSRPAVMLLHCPGLKEFSKIAADDGQARRLREAGQKRSHLEKKLKLRPSDGDLGLELAIARMELGDYNVQKLLDAALKNGGDKKRTMEMMVISMAVSGNIEGAKNSTKKAVSEKLGGRFEIYEENLSYLTGEKELPAKIFSQAADGDGFINGFGHFLAGLVDEKKGLFDRAAVEFAKAHKCGLLGESVIKKIMENYQKTDKNFRQSAEGVEVAMTVSDAYLK